MIAKFVNDEHFDPVLYFDVKYYPPLLIDLDRVHAPRIVN